MSDTTAYLTIAAVLAGVLLVIACALVWPLIHGHRKDRP